MRALLVFDQLGHAPQALFVRLQVLHQVGNAALEGRVVLFVFVAAEERVARQHQACLDRVAIAAGVPLDGDLKLGDGERLDRLTQRRERGLEFLNFPGRKIERPGFQLNPQVVALIGEFHASLLAWLWELARNAQQRQSEQISRRILSPCRETGGNFGRGK